MASSSRKASNDEAATLVLHVAADYVAEPSVMAAICSSLRAATIKSYGPWLVRRQKAGELSPTDAMVLAVRYGWLEAVECVTMHNRKEGNHGHVLKALMRAAGRPRVVRWLLERLPDNDAAAEAPDLLIAALRVRCHDTAQIALERLQDDPPSWTAQRLARGMTCTESVRLGVALARGGGGRIEGRHLRDAFWIQQRSNLANEFPIATPAMMAELYEGDPEARAQALREAEAFCKASWWKPVVSHLRRLGIEWARSAPDVWPLPDEEEVSSVARAIYARCQRARQPRYVAGPRCLNAEIQRMTPPQVGHRFCAVLAAVMDMLTADWPELVPTMAISKDCVLSSRDGANAALVRRLRAGLASSSCRPAAAAAAQQVQ